MQGSSPVARGVRRDGVTYCSPYGGFGVSLIRTKDPELGVHLTRGVRFYGDYSNAGLRNDVFGTTPFTHATLEATVRYERHVAPPVAVVT